MLRCVHLNITRIVIVLELLPTCHLEVLGSSLPSMAIGVLKQEKLSQREPFYPGEAILPRWNHSTKGSHSTQGGGGVGNYST